MDLKGSNCKYKSREEREREVETAVERETEVHTKFIAQLCLSRLLFKSPPPGFGILFPSPNSPGRWGACDPDPLLIPFSPSSCQSQLAAFLAAEQQRIPGFYPNTNTGEFLILLLFLPRTLFSCFLSLFPRQFLARLCVRFDGVHDLKGLCCFLCPRLVDSPMTCSFFFMLPKLPR